MNYALSFSRSAAKELKEYNKIKRAPSRVDQPNATSPACRSNSAGNPLWPGQGEEQRAPGSAAWERGWQPPRQRKALPSALAFVEKCIVC